MLIKFRTVVRGEGEGSQETGEAPFTGLLSSSLLWTRLQSTRLSVCPASTTMKGRRADS